jgi:hypothetical protein
MKTTQLRIGAKGVDPVKVPLRVPENIDELSQLARGNVEVILRWAKRGMAIEHQERSGARDKVVELRKAGNLTQDQITEQVAKVVADYDPTVAAVRGGTRERKPIEIKTGKGGKISMDEFRAQLEAAGVKLNFAEVAGQAAQG